MKRQKLFTVLLSTLTAAACSLSVFAGCARHEGCPNSDDGAHKYREQAGTVKPSTCTTQGSHTLICGLCGDVTEESLPLDPDAHDYGEWAIEKPSEQEAGLATKTCSYNAEHKVEVTLPRIVSGGAGYDLYQILKPATAVEAGTLHLEIERAEGDISFDVTIPKRTVTTVGDAVDLGTSLGGMIRLSKGRSGVTYKPEIDPDPADVASGKVEVINGNMVKYSAFECEFGEGFTHITDEGNKEQYWYSLDNSGKPYGVYQREELVDVAPPDSQTPQLVTKLTTPAKVEGAIEKNLLGFGYLPGVNDVMVYGAENALATYFEMASVARADGTAVGYDQQIIKHSDGSIDAWFTYGHYENPNFGRYKMEFHLNSTGVITTLKLTTSIIRAYMIAEDADGEKLFYPNGDVVFAEEYAVQEGEDLIEYEADGRTPVIEGVKTDAQGTELLDKNGNTIPRYKPKTGAGYNPQTVADRNYYSYEHQQVSTRILHYTERVLKTPDDEEPENPYPGDTLYIHSFDVRYAGKVVGNEGISIPSNQAIELEIINVKPEGTATLDYDPLDVYVRTQSRDVPLTLTATDNEYLIRGSFNKDSKRVVVNAQRAGDVTLVLKTSAGLYETTVTLHVQKSAPSDLFPEVYAYNVINNQKVYRWTTALAEPNEAPGEGEPPIEYFTVYAGQPFYVRATCDPLEAAYSDTTFELETYRTYSFMEIENHVMLDGQEVTKVTVNQAGTYDDMWLSYVRYDESRDKYVSNGNANGSFRLIVLEKPSYANVLRGKTTGEGEFTAKLQYIEVNGDIQPATAEIKFSFEGTWREGTITVKVGDGTTTYDYVADNDGNITATFKSGPNGDTYDFTFKINEAYDIEMTHPNGYPDEFESVVLSEVVKTAETSQS